ncbi:MAG: type II toxin-antitoxin system RelE/ParE family toxin [Trebonia sp.]
MEVAFDDPDLEETFRNVRDLRKKHGVVRAKKIEQRLEDLEAAETLAVMRSLPGRCHELHGDRAGQLSLDLDHPYRLLIRPADDPGPGPGGGLDWSEVRAVVVIGIEDTHR